MVLMTKEARYAEVEFDYPPCSTELWLCFTNLCVTNIL